MILDIVVGCRPNFVKAAALIEAAKKFDDVVVRLIHTGQHSDIMSDPFFKELNLPKPAWSIIGYDIHPSVRLGNMVSAIGAYWTGNPKPDWAIIVGDTDSSLAGAIAAKKSKLKVAHVEAGLRSGLVDMQEEINRKMIDSISDRLYTTSRGAAENLTREGHMPWTIYFAGNVMVDTLLLHIGVAKKKYPRRVDNEYALLTLHRAENVDDQNAMNGIMEAVREIAKRIPVIFPRHPRGHVDIDIPGVKVVPPMGYYEFIAEMSHATYVLTDSGGVQEETTVLETPCVTLRPNTERPETVHEGSNNIAGTHAQGIIAAANSARYQSFDTTRFGRRPEKWDGRAAERIISDLVTR
jgi:UDP-N-acetylglucosamine 2-epimerase (non-hydrolysing)